MVTFLLSTVDTHGLCIMSTNIEASTRLDRSQHTVYTCSPHHSSMGTSIYSAMKTPRDSIRVLLGNPPNQCKHLRLQECPLSSMPACERLLLHLVVHQRSSG